MAVTIRQLGMAMVATVVVGAVFYLPTSAFAQNESNGANIRLGSNVWDPGGGNFRWNYGPGISWYYGVHKECRVHRHTYVNRRGHRVTRWTRRCY